MVSERKAGVCRTRVRSSLSSVRWVRSSVSSIERVGFFLGTGPVGFLPNFSVIKSMITCSLHHLTRRTSCVAVQLMVRKQ